MGPHMLYGYTMPVDLSLSAPTMSSCDLGDTGVRGPNLGLPPDPCFGERGVEAGDFEPLACLVATLSELLGLMLLAPVLVELAATTLVFGLPPEVDGMGASGSSAMVLVTSTPRGVVSSKLLGQW